MPEPEPPRGYVALPLGKGCFCVIPAAVYVAGLCLGKQLRRAQAAASGCRKEATSDA